jgi:hypothetical protein
VERLFRIRAKKQNRLEAFLVILVRNETVSHVQTSPMRAFQPAQRVYISKADVNPDTA